MGFILLNYDLLIKESRLKGGKGVCIIGLEFFQLFFLDEGIYGKVIIIVIYQ